MNRYLALNKTLIPKALAISVAVVSPSFTLAEQTNPFVNAGQPVSSTSQARLLPPPSANNVQTTDSSLRTMPDRIYAASNRVHFGPDIESFESAATDQPARPSRLPVSARYRLPEDRRPTTGWPQATPPEPSRLAQAAAQSKRIRIAQKQAAQQQAAMATANHSPASSSYATASVFLASQTAKSQVEQAMHSLEQAKLEYSCSAFASAETSAWSALQQAAEAIDLAETRSQTNLGSGAKTHAVQRLRAGRQALLEARDFVGPYAHNAKDAIARLARSHQTAVVRRTLPQRTATGAIPQVTLTTSEVIDRYLDFARSELSVIAGKSLLAAQSMDLLAAITLGRNETARLPGPTAICLRRAAVQGQSNHPDLVARLGHHLADIGLIDEARWALQHSLRLAYNPVNAARLASLNQPIGASPMRTQQTTRPLNGPMNIPYDAGSSILAASMPSPEVTQIDPRQFAAISPRPVINTASANHSQGQSPFSVASYRPQAEAPPTAPTEQKQSTPAKVASRLLPMMKKWW